MKKWKKLRERVTDLSNYYDLGDSAYGNGYRTAAVTILREMERLDTNGDDLDGVSVKPSELPKAKRAAERDQLKVEVERLQKEIAELEDITEQCCKPAQEEIRRLWHENELLVGALEEIARLFTNSSLGAMNIIKETLKDR